MPLSLRKLGWGVDVNSFYGMVSYSIVVTIPCHLLPSSLHQSTPTTIRPVIFSCICCYLMNSDTHLLALFVSYILTWQKYPLWKWPLCCIRLFADNSMQNMISPSTTCSWINIFVDPGTTFRSTYQIWGTSLTFMSSLGLQPGLGASTSMLFTYHFLLILGITFG